VSRESVTTPVRCSWAAGSILNCVAPSGEVIPGDGTFELTMTDKKRRELQELIRAGEHHAETVRLELRLAAVTGALAIQTVDALLDEMRDALAGAVAQQAKFDQTHARLRDLLKAEKTE
jgi:hypothetical protein